MTSLYLTGISLSLPQNKSPEKESDSKKVQDLYLRYLIDKETNFANFDKIDTYYQSTVIDKYRQYNHNKHLLEQKKADYAKLLMELINQVCQNYVFPQTEINNVYDKQIADLNQQIQVQEHQDEVYAHLYNRLYHENYMMKKRIETEQKYSSIYSQQHEKYLMIKHHSKMVMQKQQRTLNETTAYFSRSNDKKQSELSRKGKKMKQLESEVAFVRLNIAKYRQTMKTMHDSKALKLKEKNKRQRVNEFELANYLARKREYHKVHTHVLSIFKELQVKDLDELIAKFIKIKVEIQNIHFVFGFENESIQQLNYSHTKYEKLLSSYQKQILLKRNSSLIDANMNHKATLLKSRLDEKRYTLSELQQIHTKRLFFFQKVLSFLINSNRKVNKEIKVKAFTRKRGSLQYIATDKEVTAADKDIDANFMRDICELLVLFGNSLFFLLFRSINVAITQKLLFSLPDKSSSTRVFDLYSIDYMASYQALAEKAQSNVETKLKYIKKNEDNLYVNLRKLNEEKDARMERKGITQRELFQSFINHLEGKKKGAQKYLAQSHNASFNGSSFIERHPRKVISILEKYQNELVMKDRMPLIKASSIENRANRTTAVSINTQRKNNSREHTVSTVDRDNSYENSKRESRRAKEVRPTQLLYSFYKGNEQMSKIYTRLNDLRSLELKYKEKKDLHHEEYIELYKSFKNKILLKDKRKRQLSQSMSHLKTNRIVRSEESRSNR